MLVLNRRCEEGITIGNEIRVRVLAIQRGRVRLGIDAPCEFQIWRGELRVAGILPAPVEGVSPSDRGQDALATRGRGRPRHDEPRATGHAPRN